MFLPVVWTIPSFNGFLIGSALSWPLETTMPPKVVLTLLDYHKLISCTLAHKWNAELFRNQVSFHLDEINALASEYNNVLKFYWGSGVLSRTIIEYPYFFRSAISTVYTMHVMKTAFQFNGCFSWEAHVCCHITHEGESPDVDTSCRCVCWGKMRTRSIWYSHMSDDHDLDFQTFYCLWICKHLLTWRWQRWIVFASELDAPCGSKEKCFL